MARFLRKLEYCTNCETPLDEDCTFCPHCGQKNLDRKVPFWVFTWEFIQQQLHLDTRWWKTLSYFFTRPGRLTTEFIRGRRKRYVPPAQFFLIMGFFCFFVIVAFFNDSVDPETFNKGSFEIGFVDDTPADDNMVEAFLRGYSEEAKARPDEFIRKGLRQLPLVLLVTLPIYALVLKLFYIRRKYFLVEHLVFLLHIHTMLFVILMAGFLSGLLGWFPPWWPVLLVLGFLTYLILSFRNVYGQVWWKSTIKFIMLAFIYFLLMPTLMVLGGVFAGLIS